MNTDQDFVARLLADPTDDTARLVYADWLEEQDDPAAGPKAAFLRLTVQLAEPGRTAGWRKPRRKKIQALAATLDTDWLAVVSRVKVESCGGKRAGQPRWSGFAFVCDRPWEEMTPTADPAVRSCAACRENVHYCGTIGEARGHAEAGHCVAVDLGVIRRPRDLEPPVMMAGLVDPEYWRREEERLAPDPVSAERERRKGGGAV